MVKEGPISFTEGLGRWLVEKGALRDGDLEPHHAEEKGRITLTPIAAAELRTGQARRSARMRWARADVSRCLAAAAGCSPSSCGAVRGAGRAVARPRASRAAGRRRAGGRERAAGELEHAAADAAGHVRDQPLGGPQGSPRRRGCAPVRRRAARGRRASGVRCRAVPGPRKALRTGRAGLRRALVGHAALPRSAARF